MAGGACSPVTWTTYASARIAESRSSATTSAAPEREISGPGFTSLVAVFNATVQSTIEVVMPSTVDALPSARDQPRHPQVAMAADT